MKLSPCVRSELLCSTTLYFTVLHFVEAQKQGELLYYTAHKQDCTFMYCTKLYINILYYTLLPRCTLALISWVRTFQRLWDRSSCALLFYTIKTVPHYTSLISTTQSQPLTLGTRVLDSHHFESLRGIIHAWKDAEGCLEFDLLWDTETGWAPVLHCTIPYCNLYLTKLHFLHCTWLLDLILRYATLFYTMIEAAWVLYFTIMYVL